MFFFKSRRKKNEVNAFMRRLVDRTTPAFRHEIEELRTEPRANRSLPVLIVPIIDEEPDTALTAFGVTKDLSSNGMAVLSQQPISSEAVIVGLWNDQCCEFMRATIRHQEAIEGGYWQMGLKLTEVVPRGDYINLSKLAVLADRITADDKPANFELSMSLG